MKSRTRSRKAASIGSNQSLKSDTASSTSGCTASRFVVGLVMAWSPARRANAGFDWVRQSGDYAIRNSNQHRDSTRLGPQALWTVANGEEELRRGAMADRVPRKERGCQLVDDGDDHGVEIGDLVVQLEVAPSQRAERDPVRGNHIAIVRQVRPPGGQGSDELHAGHPAQRLPQFIGRGDDRGVDHLQSDAAAS